MTKPKISIIGHFGGRKRFNDGQTVKTITVYEALKRAGFDAIYKVDTYYIRKNPFRFLHELIWGVARSPKIIVLLSAKGRKFLFPLLYTVARAMKKEIYHYSIGGRLALEVRKRPRWKKYVSSFKGNWMESRSLAEELQKIGLKNAIYIPNFKRLPCLSEQDLPKVYDEPFRFAFFSRVMEEKGVEDAVEAIHAINLGVGRQMATLDIYGPVNSTYEDHLNEVLKRDNDCCYRGVVSAEKSVETLKNYYALLFPTHWRHEGIPGTIIDALSSGIPVIARRWQYCDEMLKDSCTGLIYDFDRPEQLREKMLFAIKNKELVISMKENCLQKAKEYSEGAVIKEILKEMGLE